MAEHDRLSVIEAWRLPRDDPHRLPRMRRHAVDMILDSCLLDGLSEDERLAYIELATESLAEGLATFLDWWTLNDSPPVDQVRAGVRRARTVGQESQRFGKP